MIPWEISRTALSVRLLSLPLTLKLMHEDTSHVRVGSEEKPSGNEIEADPKLTLARAFQRYWEKGASGIFLYQFGL